MSTSVFRQAFQEPFESPLSVTQPGMSHRVTCYFVINYHFAWSYRMSSLSSALGGSYRSLLPSTNNSQIQFTIKSAVKHRKQLHFGYYTQGNARIEGHEFGDDDRRFGRRKSGEIAKIITYGSVVPKTSTGQGYFIRLCFDLFHQLHFIFGSNLSQTYSDIPAVHSIEIPTSASILVEKKTTLSTVRVDIYTNTRAHHDAKWLRWREEHPACTESLEQYI